jgi:AraC family transcriptional regulator
VPLEVALKPVETLLFSSDAVALGTFRCRAAHPLYANSGPCSHHTFVFPRSASRIRHDGGPSFIGSPNSVSLYNQHQRYTREAIDPIDASDWIVLSDDVLFEAIADFDPRVAERPLRPFVHASTPIDAETYLAQRHLFDAIVRGEVDAFAAEESALRLFTRVLSAAYQPKRRKRAQHERVEAAKSILAAAPQRKISLLELARAVELSPYHLCRLFRGSEGMSLTEYRHSLRLRLALGRLRDGAEDLSALAQDLGYSSHSHFTAVFRRHFGITPSQVRARF